MSIGKQNEQNDALGLLTILQHISLSGFYTAALTNSVAAIVTYTYEVVRTHLREQTSEGVFWYI